MPARKRSVIVVLSRCDPDHIARKPTNNTQPDRVGALEVLCAATSSRFPKRLRVSKATFQNTSPLTA